MNQTEALLTRRQWVLTGLGLLALLAGVAWAFRPLPVLVETASVRQGLFEQTVEEEGKTRVRDRFVVSAPVAARVSRVRFKVGDEVRAGATVAILWPAAPPMIDARARRELTERVGALKASLSRAELELQSADVALKQAQTDLARIKQLRAEGFASAAALDQAQLAWRLQTQAREAAQAVREGAEHELAQGRAALLRARDEPGSGRTGIAWMLTSPIEGRVLRVLQESEAVVGVGAPLIELGDPNKLEVVVPVLSVDGARIPIGADVGIDAGERLHLIGRVYRIEPSAFTKVSALGIEEQRVNVLIDIASPPQLWRGLGDQFRVDVRIVVQSRNGAVVAPIGALFRDGEQWAVFVVRDGRARKRQVKLGGRTSSEAWIESGLAVDEHVVTYPSDKLAEGKRIKVVRGPA
jgi:HlyD family secretion protein